MSALSEARSSGAIPSAVIEMIKQYGGQIIWAYIHAHSNDRAFHVEGKVFGVIPYSVTLKVNDPRVLAFVTWLIGPDTTGIQPGVPNS